MRKKYLQFFLNIDEVKIEKLVTTQKSGKCVSPNYQPHL